MVVSPRLTSFMSGETLELMETCVKPARVASSPTRRSMAGYLMLVGVNGVEGLWFRVLGLRLGLRSGRWGDRARVRVGIGVQGQEKGRV